MKQHLKTIFALTLVTISFGLRSHFVSGNPCISTIRLTNTKFSINEPILVFYDIQNISKDTVTIWHSGFWPNNKIVATDSNNIEVPRTEWGKMTLSAFSPGGPRLKNYPVRLAPGEIDSAYEKYDLQYHFIFEKGGVYNVTYYYHEMQSKAEIKVQSNTVKIQIRN